MELKAASLSGLMKALLAEGFLLADEVPFRRSPFKCNGRWVCEVQP